MSIALRRGFTLAAAAVVGVVVGGGFDAAEVTPNYDSDMTIRGLIAGAALGVVAAMSIRE